MILHINSIITSVILVELVELLELTTAMVSRLTGDVRRSLVVQSHISRQR